MTELMMIKGWKILLCCCYSCLNGLKLACTGLIRTFHDVGKIVADSLSVLSHCRYSIPGSLEDIVACSDYLARLSLVCKRMKKNSDFLHIIGLNIRIESTRTKVTAAMFQGFGGEIKALAAKLGERISAVHSSAEKVQTDHISMQSQIPQNMKSFDLLAVSTKKPVAPATEEIQSIGNQAAMILEKAGDHSLKISRIVGEIVRQQIEHIISGMEDILSILTIQAAQLKRGNSEAHRVYDNIETAFEQISKEVVQLINDVAGSGSMEKGGIDVEKRFYSFQSNVVPSLFQFTDVASDINVALQYKCGQCHDYDK